MTGSGNLELEYEAFHKVGTLLFALPSPNDDSVELTVSMVGNIALASILAYGENGTHDTPKGRANALRVTDEMWDAIIELRRAHYREGSGTWFSASMTLDLDGATTSYNYNDEPNFDDTIVESSEYVTDQELFPRNEDKQPDWLKKKLSGN